MATREEISAWFDSGVLRKAKYMLVIYDTFDRIDYFRFVFNDKDCIDTYLYPGEMQTVMEVYDLCMDKEMQLNEWRAKHLPK